MNRNRLIVFTRFPEAGKTKTRLIPELGAEGAAQLQRELTEYFIATCRQASALFPFEIEVCFTGADDKCFSSWLGEGLSYRPQEGSDLGERMKNAFRSAFDEGCSRVILTGIDCPYLTTSHLGEALTLLENDSVVIGPAEDGGYTLIGLSAPNDALFAGIPWGTSTVLANTLAAVNDAGLSPALLPTLADIDRAEDVARWHEFRGSIPGPE